jgi:hypothetical protein
MRLRALVFAAVLGTSVGTWCVPASAQQQPAAASTTSSGQDKNTDDLKLPVSIDKIREGLSQPAPAEPLKGLNDAPPTFKVEINEQQKFDEFLAKVKFDKGGPQIAGGIDAYEQYQRVFPRIDNPLVQPYGAFTTGQLLTLGVEALVEKYVAQKMSQVVGSAARAQAEREAREEVARSLAQYWASQSAVPSAAPTPKE